ncbi:MAG: hypothetical protein M3Q07_25395, partial [Pseudobdellovibrionaceae bacterium]|nr:hypothetical protein [Pseudobdellovibrionaceae bacterium]
MQFPRTVLLIGALLVTVMSCDSEDSSSLNDTRTPPAHAHLGEATIDSSLLEISMVSLVGPRSHPALAVLPKTFPVLVQNQKITDALGTVSFKPIGFAILCKGRDPKDVATAFGNSFIDSNSTEMTEDDLVTALEVDQQPILRCDALPGQGQGTPLFSQVFRVIDQKTQKVNWLARFTGPSPQDKRIFEFGCQNTLDAFWRETSVPILKESLKDLPGSDDIVSLHCFNGAKALAQDQSVGSYPLQTSSSNARLYRAQDNERGEQRVLISNGLTFKLKCGATDGDLQKAFGLMETGSIESIKSGDAAFEDYLKGEMDKQPVLTCASALNPNFASDAYHVFNEGPLDAATAARNPLLRLTNAQDTLVQFECESAAQFFGSKLLSQLSDHP